MYTDHVESSFEAEVQRNHGMGADRSASRIIGRQVPIYPEPDVVRGGQILEGEATQVLRMGENRAGKHGQVG
jgi:hypothetical protein